MREMTNEKRNVYELHFDVINERKIIQKLSLRLMKIQKQ